MSKQVLTILEYSDLNLALAFRNDYVVLSYMQIRPYIAYMITMIFPCKKSAFCIVNSKIIAIFALGKTP